MREGLTNFRLLIRRASHISCGKVHATHHN
jgi:hypothetical protein